VCFDAVETGASRREAAERFEVSASSTVKWMQRWHETGSVAAKPTGGSISPLEDHADFLMALIAEQPDLTLDEIVAAMRKRRITEIAGSSNLRTRTIPRRAGSFPTCASQVARPLLGGGAVGRSLRFI
jgi:transposase